MPSPLRKQSINIALAVLALVSVIVVLVTTGIGQT